MKKIAFLFHLLSLIITVSCSSSDEDNISNPDSKLSKWTMRYYNANNKLLNSEENIINEGRITQIIYKTYDDNGNVNSLSERNFSYTNGLLTNIYWDFGSGLNNFNTDFYYDENNNLVEFIGHTENTSLYSKSTYEYLGNIATLTQYQSNDNGQNYQLLGSKPSLEMTFDMEDNLTLSKPSSTGNNGFETIEYAYDSKSNLVKVLKYPDTEINFTYSNLENPVGQSYTATYGKKGFGLVFNNNLFFWRNGSPNAMTTLNGEGIGDYSVNNLNSSGKLTEIQINTDNFSDGTIDSRTVIEFEYN